MKGTSISLASKLSARTYVYTPTLKAPNIEVYAVTTSGATDSLLNSGSTSFMIFNATHGINI